MRTVSPLLVKVGIGAVSGFLAALRTDLRAYAKAKEDGKPFSWRVASVRWAEGTVGGVLVALVGGAVTEIAS